MCYSPWGSKEPDTTERLNWTEKNVEIDTTKESTQKLKWNSWKNPISLSYLPKREEKKNKVGEKKSQYVANSNHMEKQ